MKHFIIHIGPHKTGSSYLQSAFKTLGDELGKHGVLFPDQWLQNTAPGHGRLFNEVRTEKLDCLIEEFDNLRRTNYDKILISSEDLADLLPQEISNLRSLIGGDRATIVFYCRSWAERLVSGWKESLRHGNTETLPEFLIKDNLGRPTISNSINPAVVLGRYENVFGKNNIKLISYDQILYESRSILNHFVNTILGVRIDKEAIPTIWLNVSPNEQNSEIARALNVLDPQLGRRYLERFQKLDIPTLHELMSSHVRILHIDENDPVFRDFHSGIFEKYQDRLLLPHPSWGLFTPKTHAITYISSDYLLNPQGSVELSKLQRLLEV